MDLYVYTDKMYDNFTETDREELLRMLGAEERGNSDNPRENLYHYLATYMHQSTDSNLRNNPDITLGTVWTDADHIMYTDFHAKVLGTAKNTNGESVFFTSVGTITVKR